MSVLLEVLFLLFGILFIVWLWLQSNKNKKLYHHIPGPPGLPILGNALDFKSTTSILPMLEKYKETYGSFFKLRIGPSDTYLIVSDYKFLEFIFTTPSLQLKAHQYDYFKPWLGTGLLISDGYKWKTHRKVLTPGFHFQILEQFVNVFESCGKKLVEKLEKELDKSSFDIYTYITLCALDIICESTMGITVNAQKDDTSEYVQNVKAMGIIIMERVLSPLQFYKPLFSLSPNYYKQRKALKILHSYSNAVIAKRREVKGKQQNGNVNTFEQKKAKTFLDILLECTIDGQPLTDEEIREEVDTFMFEGHDTTASAVSFTLYCLANHPDVQTKVLQEQVYIFDDIKNPSVTYANLQEMKYLEQVIKESLRLYPAVPGYGRRNEEDIKFGDILIPKNSTLSIIAYSIQRDPKYYKNPNEFNPDRFQEIDGKSPYAYIPFSAGSRNCIGQKFAMLEMKSVISKIIRKFVLLPAIPTHILQLSAETVLKSANGINIALQLRT